MLEKVIDSVTTKLGIMIAVWAASLCMGALTVTIALGMAAFDDNTVAMQKYSESNNELVKGVEEVREMASELRRSSFRDGLRLLAKQSFKMENDPGDIKLVDVASSSDFCASNLFNDYISGVNGSEKILIVSNCTDADSWMRTN